LTRPGRGYIVFPLTPQRPRTPGAHLSRRRRQVGLHALRHTVGTRLQRQTGDLTKVADHLGHATLDMARNYAKADDRALKAVVDEW